MVDIHGRDEAMKPEELIGCSITSWGRTISESEFTLLTDLTWLVAALHTDEEYMKLTSFGTRILAAPLVLALTLGLAASTGARQKMHSLDWTLKAIVGLEDVRFLAPLKVGDTLTVQTTFREWRATSKDHRRILVMQQTGRNQNGQDLIDYRQLVLFEKLKPIAA
jgi:acyl dehydratase